MLGAHEFHTRIITRNTKIIFLKPKLIVEDHALSSFELIGLGQIHVNGWVHIGIFQNDSLTDYIFSLD